MTGLIPSSNDDFYFNQLFNTYKILTIVVFVLKVMIFYL